MYKMFRTTNVLMLKPTLRYDDLSSNHTMPIEHIMRCVRAKSSPFDPTVDMSLVLPNTHPPAHRTCVIYNFKIIKLVLIVIYTKVDRRLMSQHTWPATPTYDTL